ncbi:MAG: hypothetical protein Q7R60_01130 [bacterium]|nr:hypothetical protein [bacterium]
MSAPPKLRFWQSRGKTLRVVELSFDLLRTLAHAKQPRSVSDLMNARGLGQLQSGYMITALLVLAKSGHIQGDGKISRIRLSGDTTKVSITPAGLQLLKESRTRLEFAERLLGEK